MGSGPARLVLANAVLPPFVMAPGEPAQGEGIDIELARMALQAHGVRIDVVLVPWRRVLQMLERGEADFTTTASRLPERDGYLVYSRPYRTQASFVFYTRRGQARPIERPQDLQGREVVTTAGFYMPPELSRLGLRAAPAVRDMPTALKMVAAGRVDAALVGGIGGPWAVAQLGLSGELQPQPLVIHNQNATHMAFSKRKHEQGPWVMRMNEGLQRLLAAGRVAQVEQRYLASASAAVSRKP